MKVLAFFEFTSNGVRGLYHEHECSGIRPYVP